MAAGASVRRQIRRHGDSLRARDAALRPITAERVAPTRRARRTARCCGACAPYEERATRKRKCNRSNAQSEAFPPLRAPSAPLSSHVYPNAPERVTLARPALAGRHTQRTHAPALRWQPRLLVGLDARPLRLLRRADVVRHGEEQHHRPHGARHEAQKLGVGAVDVAEGPAGGRAEPRGERVEHVRVGLQGQPAAARRRHRARATKRRVHTQKGWGGLADGDRKNICTRDPSDAQQTIYDAAPSDHCHQIITLRLATCAMPPRRGWPRMSYVTWLKTRQRLLLARSHVFEGAS